MRDKYFKLRNSLNSIFILGAFAGMGIYMWGNQTWGGIVIIVAIAFKFAECCIRMLKR